MWSFNWLIELECVMSTTEVKFRSVMVLDKRVRNKASLRLVNLRSEDEVVDQ